MEPTFSFAFSQIAGLGPIRFYCYPHSRIVDAVALETFSSDIWNLMKSTAALAERLPVRTTPSPRAKSTANEEAEKLST